jgi:hypothetical protein
MAAQGAFSQETYFSEFVEACARIETEKAGVEKKNYDCFFFPFFWLYLSAHLTQQKVYFLPSMVVVKAAN